MKTDPSTGRNDVVVSTDVLTNQGRAFRWQSRAVFGGSLTAVFRLPYATGLNGRVTASAYRVASAGTERRVTVGESQVAGGAAIALDFD